MHLTVLVCSCSLGALRRERRGDERALPAPGRGVTPLHPARMVGCVWGDRVLRGRTDCTFGAPVLMFF